MTDHTDYRRKLAAIVGDLERPFREKATPDGEGGEYERGAADAIAMIARMIQPDCEADLLADSMAELVAYESPDAPLRHRDDSDTGDFHRVMFRGER